MAFPSSSSPAWLAAAAAAAADEAKVRNTGRWNEEERAKFDAAFREVGGNWKLISKRIGTRSNIQCRTHGQKIAALARATAQQQHHLPQHHLPHHLVRHDDGDECDDEDNSGEEKTDEGPSPPLSRVHSNMALFQPLPPPWTYPYQRLELASFLSNAATAANAPPATVVACCCCKPRCQGACSLPGPDNGA